VVIDDEDDIAVFEADVDSVFRLGKSVRSICPDVTGVGTDAVVGGDADTEADPIPPLITTGDENDCAPPC
jgi:hypothetical protein